MEVKNDLTHVSRSKITSRGVLEEIWCIERLWTLIDIQRQHPNRHCGNTPGLIARIGGV